MKNKTALISGIVGIAAFICSMLMLRFGIIKDTTLYYVTNDIIRYVSIMVIILIVLCAVAIGVAFRIVKGSGNGLVAFGISGTIILVVVRVIKVCAVLYMLFIFTDILNCEFGFIERTGYIASGFAPAIIPPPLYSIIFSGNFAVATTVLYNIIRIIACRKH